MRRVSKYFKLSIAHCQLSNLALLVIMLCGFPSCNNGISDLPIPDAFFAEITFNLNQPQYITLKSDGGLVAIDGGVRGIILYRKNATTYLAFERNCSYQPNDACATVEPHSSNLFLIDVCCGSSFDLEDGKPTGGAAWRPLRIYKTYLVGDDLTITADSANGM
jgi:hypothetical protein